MQLFVRLLLWFSVTLSCQGVTQLTDDSFDAHLARFKHVLIKFYQPTCKISEQMRPEFDAASDELQDLMVDGWFSMVRIDGTAHEQVRRRFGVSVYPMLKWVVDGIHTDYDGGKKRHQIVRWVRNKISRPPYLPIPDLEELSRQKEEHEVLVVGYFQDLDSPNARTFKTIAQSDDQVVYGLSSDAKVGEMITGNPNNDDGVGIFRHFDEPYIYCTHSGLNRETIQSCIQENRLPILKPYSKEIVDNLTGNHRYCFLFLDPKDPHYHEQISSAKNVAKKYLGKFHFFTVDRKPGNLEVFMFFNMNWSTQLPAARLLIVPTGGEVEKYASNVNQEWNPALTALLENPSPHKVGVKSQDIQSDDFSNRVKILRGLNHDEFVYGRKNTKMLVMYFSAESEICEKLMPGFEKLAEIYDEKGIEFAKFDILENQVQGFEIPNIPTFLFFPENAMKGQHIYFHGHQTIENLEKFINEKVNA